MASTEGYDVPQGPGVNMSGPRNAEKELDLEAGDEEEAFQGPDVFSHDFVSELDEFRDNLNGKGGRFIEEVRTRTEQREAPWTLA